MRGQFTFLLIVTVIFAGTYFYREASSVCAAPIEYRIGTIDTGFTITEGEAIDAVETAAAIWEEAAGRDLFIYDEDSSFTINFVFDDRQAYAEAEVDFREKLNVTEGVNDKIGETYEELTIQYDTLEVEYQEKVDAYERALATYNSTVKGYNEAGGAPPEVYAELEAERDKLDVWVSELETLGNNLNDLARRINQVGEQGNKLVEVYNRNVAQYNEAFGEAQEFTQGDYRGDRINVYKFIDTEELELVLAHELGHALTLGHVRNEASIMYHLMGGQPDTLQISSEDASEFERVCGDTSLIARFRLAFGI